MSLITAYRPKSWSEVIGQDALVTLLQSMLKTPKLRLQGTVLSGCVGVGKTTVAYLLARSLLCTGASLGCGKCSSCITVDTQGIGAHPDVREIDAAETSGVENARHTVDELEALPILGACRVLIVDEAHRLSKEAWDVYLKPLESNNAHTHYIFSSNQGDIGPSVIPESIRSRCFCGKFSRLQKEELMGLLCKVASQEHLEYQLDAMEYIATIAKGVPREALNILDRAASLGVAITRENLSAVCDTSLPDGCLKLLKAILRKEQAAAITLADELGLKYQASDIVSEVFASYSRVALGRVEGLSVNAGAVPSFTSVCLKWNNQSIPADALPLFIYELITSQESSSAAKPLGTSSSTSRGAVNAISRPASTLKPRELSSILGATLE